MCEITVLTKESLQYTLLVKTIDDAIRETRKMRKFDTKLVDLKLKCKK